MRNDLVERLIGSETKAELLMFFHDHPDTTDTIEGIAAKIQRQPREIERDILDLAKLGLLQEVRLISFNKDRDQELQREISKRLISPPSQEESSPSVVRDVTGVIMVDALLPEGYPSSSAVLVMGDPSTGKTSLIVQMVVEALKKGREVVYATLDDFPDSVRDSIRIMGPDPNEFESEGERKLVFIDCYSFLVGLKSKEQYSEDPQRLSDLSIIVSKVLSESKDPSKVLFTLDSLTTLVQRTGVRPAFDFLHTLVAKIRGSKASCIASLSRKAFHPAIIAALQDKVDGVIEMKTEEGKDGLARFIRIPKMKGARHVTIWTPYEREPTLGLITPTKNSIST